VQRGRPSRPCAIRTSGPGRCTSRAENRSAYDPEECGRLRARFLAEQGWSRKEEIDAEFARRDGLLAHAEADGHPIVLWAEHDLVDQLQLLQVLSRLGDDAAAELVQADDYLGALEAGALERLWPSRRPLGRDRAAGVARGVRGRPRSDARARRARPAVPEACARAAATRSARRCRGRSGQLLEALRDGPLRPLELFAANQAREEAVLLGDTWCFLFLWELARDGLVAPELPLPPPRGDHALFTAVPLELTLAGRRLV
jgi:hypothetical protein